METNNTNDSTNIREAYEKTFATSVDPLGSVLSDTASTTENIGTNFADSINDVKVSAIGRESAGSVDLVTGISDSISENALKGDDMTGKIQQDYIPTSDNASNQNGSESAQSQYTAGFNTPSGMADRPTNYNYAAPVKQVRPSVYERVFVKSLILAVAAVVLLYRNRAAVTFPVFTMVMLGILAWDAKSMGKSLIKESNGRIGIKLFYCISLVLLSVSKCITSSPDIQWADGVGIFLIFICLLLKQYCDQEATEITGQMLKMLIMLFTPLMNIARPFTERYAYRKAHAGQETKGKKTVRSVVIGLVIAVPLLAVILALLSSADLIFGDIVSDIFNSIKLPKFSVDYIGVPFKIFIGFLAFYGWIGSLPDEKFYESKEGRKFDAVVAITFNSLIALVYIFFSGIQFIYLVGKMELPGGYTYAEYAHEGFYQLLAVTILNLILVSFCKKFFKDNAVLKVVLVLISLCTYVMIASSALRMYLYVSVYGLSHLRVYVFWLLAVLAVWTTLLIVGIYKKIPFFRLITVFVTVWYLAFVFSLPDRWIAAYDLSLKNPPKDLAFEVYPDAAPVLKADGRYWSQYCQIMDSDYEKYTEKSTIKFIREYNFGEDQAMRLIGNSNPENVMEEE